MTHSIDDSRAGESLLPHLVDELLQERKRDRRAKNLRIGAMCLLGLLAVLLNFAIFQGRLAATTAPEDYAAVVKVEGMISAGSKASAEKLLPALRRAFADEKAKAVILRVNSPGGTPVQAGLIHDQIKRLKAKYDKPVYAVGEDMVTSGAYMVSVAADEIYTNPMSMVGSIGVIARGFGFTELMDKVGIERRTYTAGEHKAGLDPFAPESAEETEHFAKMLKAVHEEFIGMVSTGRGERLTTTPDMFSGRFWTGDRALELGLIDGLSDFPTVLREKVGVKHFVDYTPRPAMLSRLSRVLTKAVASTVTEARTPSLRAQP